MAKDRHSLKSGNLILTPLEPSMYDEFLLSVEHEDEFVSDFLAEKENAVKLFNELNREYLFKTLWSIVKTDKDKTQTRVGFLYFHGIGVLGNIELTIYVAKDFKNMGIGTQALKMITEWAFMQKDIYEITAYFHSENDSAIHAFTKAGYVYRETGADHIERYSRTKDPSAWKGAYVIIGVWAGALMGVAFNSLAVGLAFGLFLGFVIGAVLDEKDAKHREMVTGTKLKKERKKKKDSSINQDN